MVTRTEAIVSSDAARAAGERARSRNRTGLDAHQPAGPDLAAPLVRLPFMDRQPVSVLSDYLTAQPRVWVRRDSNFQGIYERLQWPSREWKVYASDSSGQTLHDELVAAATPAFINFDQAAAAFFGVPSKPNRNFSGRELVVRSRTDAPASTTSGCVRQSSW